MAFERISMRQTPPGCSGVTKEGSKDISLPVQSGETKMDRTLRARRERQRRRFERVSVRESKKGKENSRNHPLSPDLLPATVPPISTLSLLDLVLAYDDVSTPSPASLKQSTFVVQAREPSKKSRRKRPCRAKAPRAGSSSTSEDRPLKEREYIGRGYQRVSVCACTLV